MIIDNFLEEYIHGDKFLPVADFVVTERRRDLNKSLLDNNACVLCHTHFLEDLFNFISKSPHKYIVVSHNSDYNISEQIYSLKSKNVVKWYAQNVIIEKSDLIPLPIGIERPGCGWSWDMKLLQTEAEQPALYENLLYMCHSDSTNPKKRAPLTKNLKDKLWVTRQDKKIEFKNYLKRLHNHKMVLSPQGNGADCLRTWEALYLGVIPVTEDIPLNRYFSKLLPIIISEDLKNITEEFLWEKYYEIKSNIEKNKYNFDALKISYWNNKISRDKKLLLGRQ
ncbi:MAG: hypothetical protein ACOCV1_03725 [Bacillota bacterium]